MVAQQTQSRRRRRWIVIIGRAVMMRWIVMMGGHVASALSC